MKAKLLKLSLSTFLLFGMLSPSLNGEEKNVETVSPEQRDRSLIKVLLTETIDGAVVEVKGAYNLYDPYNGKKLESSFSKTSFFMCPTEEGIKWGQHFPGIYQVKIVPDNSQSTIVVGGIEYKGNIYAYQVEGTLNFVNELSIDDYAESILSGRSDFYQISNQEVLGAVAIAARTDAVSKIGNSKSEFWDVQSDKEGYQGYGVVRCDSMFLQALKKTSNICLKQEASIGFPVDWFKANIPLEEMQKLGDDGKDAKGMLAKFFPKASLFVFPRKS